MFAGIGAVSGQFYQLNFGAGRTTDVGLPYSSSTPPKDMRNPKYQVLESLVWRLLP
jgi:hypothetical protein